jgi:DNA invertase Pin-like site-specific DNA recombinase
MRKIKKPQSQSAPRLVRCAIYTRKSTEEGLDQDFNSLDAQREAAKAYIASQHAEGWVCLPETYDDGGYTGANLDRPALARLLTAIRQGQIDCVIIYKVDRLSRSLLDFAKMMETFEQHRVALVAVTQQFNTATPMGRLVLNVLLSFAQFERELIAERTRDKIAAARRKGKWAGGLPVLGYDVNDIHGPQKITNDIPILLSVAAQNAFGTAASGYTRAMHFASKGVKAGARTARAEGLEPPLVDDFFTQEGLGPSSVIDLLAGNRAGAGLRTRVDDRGG